MADKSGTDENYRKGNQSREYIDDILYTPNTDNDGNPNPRVIGNTDIDIKNIYIALIVNLY